MDDIKGAMNINIAKVKSDIDKLRTDIVSIDGEEKEALLYEADLLLMQLRRDREKFLGMLKELDGINEAEMTEEDVLLSSKIRLVLEEVILVEVGLLIESMEGLVNG